MCQKCVDAVKRHFPKTPKKHYHDLLMGGTCYPLGPAEEVEKNLIEAKQAGCNNWQEVCAYADKITTEAMEKYEMSKKPNVSRQRLHQLKNKAAGKCMTCGKPSGPRSIRKCDGCLDKENAHDREERKRDRT